jgi:hypothetical protein
MGYGMIVTWHSLVTPLSIFGAFWMLVITYKALKTIHKLKTTQAIAAMFLAFIAMAIISSLINPETNRRIFNTGPLDEIDFNFYGGGGEVKMDDNKIVIESEDGNRVEIPIYTN